MLIKIDRKQGKVISAPVLTQEQKDYAWEQIVEAWARKRPEELWTPGKSAEGYTQEDR